MSATTRRAALSGSATLAGLAGLVGINGTATAALKFNPDAELISWCHSRISLQKEFDALFARRNSIEDEDRTESELTLLYDREWEIEANWEEIPRPKTLAGAKAMAAALVACGSQDFHGELIAEDVDQWLGKCLAEFLAGDSVT